VTDNREVVPSEPDGQTVGHRPPIGSVTDNRPTDLALWWCKREDGTIVEHETTAVSRHEGHVRCVPVGYGSGAGSVTDNRQARCEGTLGEKPTWMSWGQYDPCRCRLAAGHEPVEGGDGGHWCEHLSIPDPRVTDNRDAEMGEDSQQLPKVVTSTLAEEAWKVVMACPQCGVPAGEHCRAPNGGRYVGNPHVARTRRGRVL
jgi:hypothetical protein